jgi:hypothetical protein
VNAPFRNRLSVNPAAVVTGLDGLLRVRKRMKPGEFYPDERHRPKFRDWFNMLLEKYALLVLGIT